jgi:hypothetical protein
MKFPILLRGELSADYEERWRRFYVERSDRNRRREDGIWRRTQEEWNAAESGWQSVSDRRRRVVHYTHEYDLQKREGGAELLFRHAYVYYSLSLPEQEIAPDLDRVKNSLQRGGWRRDAGDGPAELWRLGDLVCSLSFMARHPEDVRAGRDLPPSYRTLDVTIRSLGFNSLNERLPWEVLAQGMRLKDAREQPTYVPDLSALVQLSPFHVELGCGASIEAGIPALHHLHELYRVTDMDTGRFIFGGEQDDLIERLLTQPSAEFPALGELFGAAFVAEPTAAHWALLALRDAGHLVGPIMTNNFDGLAHRVGLSEHFLRRYDEVIPAVEFRPDARSLLVIGSHADRRRVQARARARGLKIVYLDPEGYQIDGRFIGYPLEGPRDGDSVCRKTATEGLAGLCSMLGCSAAAPVLLLEPAAIAFRQVAVDNDVSSALAEWWENFAASRPTLFNGPLVACSACALDEDGTATVAWYATSYAHYLQRGASAPVTDPARSLYCSVVLLSRTGELVIGQMSGTTSSPLRLQLPGGNITLPGPDGLSLAHCIANACEEVKEEVGLTLDEADLRLWRMKTGGAHDDIGIMFLCQLALSNAEISDIFERHKETLRAGGEIPELDRLLFVQPAHLSLDAFECVDYLPSVALALADERG